MNPKTQYKKFMELLFPEIGIASMICHGKEPYHTKSTDKPYFSFDGVFTCINQLSGNRKDDNVSVFRNFLVELDNTPIAQQQKLITDLNMPFSTATFSGNKSIHFIISLEHPLIDKDQYDDTAYMLYQVIPGIDKSNKNCSRFTRTAGALRDGDKEQTLVSINKRIPNDVFFDWLYAFKPKERMQWSHEDIDMSTLPIGQKGKLSKSTIEILSKTEIPKGERNQTLYKIACDFKNNNYSKEELIGTLLWIKLFNTLDSKEITMTIDSAYQRAKVRPRL